MADSIEREYLTKVRSIGKVLNEVLKPAGFALLVFDMNKPDGRMNYISNAHRDSMIAAMKEFIANCEGRVTQGSEVKQ